MLRVQIIKQGDTSIKKNFDDHFFQQILRQM